MGDEIECDNGYVIGMFVVGWLIGVVTYFSSFILIGLLIVKCQGKTPSDFFQFMKSRVLIGLFLAAIVLSLIIVIIVGALVCIDTGRAIGYGVLTSCVLLNIVYNIYRAVYGCCLQGK